MPVMIGPTMTAVQQVFSRMTAPAETIKLLPASRIRAILYVQKRSFSLSTHMYSKMKGHSIPTTLHRLLPSVSVNPDLLYMKM
jgi:hypothetical protein